MVYVTLEDWGERVLFGLGLDHLSLLAWHPTQPFFSYPLQMAAVVTAAAESASNLFQLSLVLFSYWLSFLLGI